MSFARTLDDIEKLGAPIVVATMILTFATMAFLLVLRETSTPFGATAPAAVPSHQAAVDEVPSAPVVASRSPDDPAAGQPSASVMPLPETSPAPRPGVPRDPKDPSPSAGEQRVFKSRKALETIDARELLRRASTPK